MCGVVGILRRASASDVVDQGAIESMAKRLHHRGPNDSGVWADSDAGIAFGHQRLSVVDLSLSGHQPMLSAAGRLVLVFNGEIYNHREIRDEIQRTESVVQWRGHSDTETLLAGIERWGLETALKKTRGMFALALWDRHERTLTLARDRIGEKPLYYGWQGDVFLFASELKALQGHPAFRAEIDSDALALYMHRGYIEAPYSIYQGVQKVLPGTYLQISAADSPGTVPTPRAYWSLRDVVDRGHDQSLFGSAENAIEQLEVELTRSISQQMIADVPVGAFLSGGIDSSTVVALMQAQSSRPVRTFTIGFMEEDYEEAKHAKLVAQYLGTEHTELYVTSREALQVIPKLPIMYDEPFGDSSAIPTFLVAQLARENVTVALSGDGGDELFGGYSRYRRTSDIWRTTTRVPYIFRKAASYGLNAYSRIAAASLTGWRAGRLASYLSARTAAECYQVQLAEPSHDIVLNAGLGIASASTRMPPEIAARNLFDAMMYVDTKAYLPDDILVKVDRASMAVSLEARVPMLDRDVVEFAWRLPLNMKVRNGEGKWILKQVLKKYVPSSLTARPKKGFGVPVGEWIVGPLRDWAEDLLSEGRLKQEGFLNPRVVRDKWARHVAGASTEGDSLWQVLMFQAWLRSAHPNLH